MSELQGKTGDIPKINSISDTCNDSSIVEAFDDTVEIDPEMEKRVLRKIDRVVLPLMCLIYFFQCNVNLFLFSSSLTGSLDLDKQGIGYAAVFGLAKDLGMNASEYSWALSIFYFGQFAAEYVFIYLMSRLPITQFVGIFV